MKLRTLLSTSALVVALTFAANGTARAQDPQSCQPGLAAGFSLHAAQYANLINAMVPQLGPLTAQLGALSNQATYDPLLATAKALAGSLPTGRVVITLPDGTVVLDTARNSLPPTDPRTNTYQHFLDKTINENHNSRIAILSTQAYPCGIALESKLSTTTGETESYFAIRLGTHLDALGTVRMSVRQ